MAKVFARVRWLLPCLIALAAGAVASSLQAQPLPQSGAESRADESDLIRRSLVIEDLAQVDVQRALGEMQQLLEAVPESSGLRRELLGLLGRMHAAAGDRETALEVVAELYRRGQSRADGSDLVARQIELRMSARATSMPRIAAPLAELADRVEAELSPRERLRYWYNLGAATGAAGDLGSSAQAYRRAVDLADAVGHLSWRSLVRSSLAGTLIGFEQGGEASLLADEAVALARQTNDPALLIDAYSTQGVVLEQAGDAEGFLAAMTLAVATALESGNEAVLPLLYGNIAHYHLVNAEYPQAERVSRQALAASEQQESRVARSLALVNLGLALIGQGQLEQGRDFVAQSVQIDETDGRLSDLAQTQLELGAALEKAGDLAGAVQAFHAARRLQDSIFREDQQRSIAALQGEYEARRRQAQIEQLDAGNALAAAKLRARGLQQWVWALLTLMLIGVLFLLASGVRELRRSNRNLMGVNAQLRLQSERDALTGLANRRHVQAVLRHEGAESGFLGCLVLVDVDHFKSINDRFGHAAGDAVLVEIARRLRASCRESDLAARWGGEEFLLLLGAMPWLALCQRVQLVLAELGRPVSHLDQRIPVSASIGFVPRPLPGEREADSVAFEESLRLVDAALYLAKLRGRDRAIGIKSLDLRAPQTLSTVAADLEQAEALGRADLVQLTGEGE